MFQYHFYARSQNFDKRLIASSRMSIFPPENLTIYEIKWKNTVEPDRPHMIIWRTHNAGSIPKAKNTRSESVTLIAFPLQRWLHERASMLRYTYIACLVLFYALESPEETSSLSINILCTFLTFTVRTACFAHLIFLI